MILKRILLNAAVTDGGGSATDTAPKVNLGEPPAEVLKGTFDTSGDGDILGEPAAEQPPKKEETIAKVEEPKGKTTPITPPKQEKAPAAPKPAEPGLLKTVPQKKADARDYTGFDENEVKLLKAMSNDAYNYVAPLLKQKKEMSKLQDATYLQHPDAYVLHPDFQRLQQEVTYAKSEADAWQEQLIKIKSGEEWQPLVGVDPKTGKFVYGDARQPTMQDEEMVRLAMNKCIQAQQQSAQQMQQMPQQFQNIAKQDLQNINAERARRFDWVANPELLKHEIELDGVGKKTVGDIRNDFISLFPAYHRNTPGVDVAADLFVAVNIYAARLRAAEAEKQVATTLKEEATRVEPTTTVRPRDPKTGKFGVTEFSLDGMPD